MAQREEHFATVSSPEVLDELFDRSSDGPVVLFLHDYYCPVSFAAYDEMVDVTGDIALIDVAAQKDLSKAVEKRTRVRHQSPQVIILGDGNPKWAASHYSITTADVTEAIADATA
jgi:monothiol bacilliredoxin